MFFKDISVLYFIAFLSFFLCLALTPLVRLLSIKKGWIAYPAKNRWHKKPTAFLGGVAIYIGIAIPLFFIADFSSILPHIIKTSNHIALPSIGAVIWIGITILFFLGLIDDFIHIKPHTKLVGQILVASMVSFSGFRLHWFSSLTVDTTLTIVWIVGITNAFNLIDNMDGLCAGIGFIAASYLALLYTGILPEAALVSVVIAGALAAFLLYNFNPASIFMGDCGSLFVGFSLSMLCLCYPETGTANLISLYVVPIMILMVPIIDTSMVTLIRILSDRKASVGGKDHTSHRLVLMGLSEKGAVVLLYGIGAVSGMSALFVSKSDSLTSPAVIIPLVLSIILMGIYLAQIRVYPEKEFSLLRGKSYTPILMELTYKRQFMLVILDFCLIAFAYYLSYRLRFDSNEFFVYFKVFLHSLPAIIVCKFAAFFVMGIYRGVWGYMSTNDVLVYLKALSLGSIMSVVTVRYIYRFETFSKGIFVIDWFLTTGFLLGSRVSFLFFRDTMKRKILAGKTVLIYGAGRGGEILLREILNNKKLKIKPVGFIDDDELKTGKTLQGYPILGAFKDIGFHLNNYKISGMLISFNNKDPQKLEAIKDFCKANHLFLKQFSIHLEDVTLEI